MKNDQQIQKDVMDQLKSDPFLNATEIGVAVKDGIVTLSGQVDSFYKKISIENAVKEVAGVKAIALDILIGLSPFYAKTDTEIAQAILHALQWHTAVQEEKIQIHVEDGKVTLSGEVDWEYERANARKAIENLEGIKSITNLITVRPRITYDDVQKKIESAFQRSASLDSRKIHVNVLGNEVILSGTVSSLGQKEDAEYAAWNVPGVKSVENNLDILLPTYSEYTDF